MSELCAKYGSSRKTACKRIGRFRLEGVHGWEDRSHAATVAHDLLLEPEHPDRLEVRLVSGNGGVRWRRHWVLWDGYFGPMRIGRFHEGLLEIEDSRRQTETTRVTDPRRVFVTYPPGRSRSN